MYNDNPPTTRLLLAVTGAMSFVLFIAGFGLLFFLSVIGPEWPWQVSKFNALLLGSAYTAALAAAVITVYERRWAPARVVMPMILIFGIVLLVVSLADLDRFDFGYYSTWLWFLLYVVIPLNAGYQIWMTRRLKPYYPHPIPAFWRSMLLIPILLLGVYGLGLLLAPDTFSGFWPWALDDFHGRTYSVLFLTPALGAMLLWRSAASIELLTTGLVLAVGGAIPIVGLGIVDRDLEKVDWSAFGTWLWLGLFAIFLLTGLGLIWRSRSHEHAEPHVASGRSDQLRPPTTSGPTNSA